MLVRLYSNCFVCSHLLVILSSYSCILIIPLQTNKFVQSFNIYNMYRIEEILKQKGITKTAFAKMLGITKQSIPNLINGNPTKARLEEMAQLLGVPTWQLFVAPEDIYCECSPKYNFCAFVRSENGDTFVASSLQELRTIVDKLEIKAKEGK